MWIKVRGQRKKKKRAPLEDRREKHPFEREGGYLETRLIKASRGRTRDTNATEKGRTEIDKPEGMIMKTDVHLKKKQKKGGLI